MDSAVPRIEVAGLDMVFDSYVVQRDINFAVAPGTIFIIMGPSGCGKSTLLRHMIGLIEPARGDVRYDGESYTVATMERRTEMGRRFGVLFQSGALWSSMTLAENVALPIREYSPLRGDALAELVSLKLALVGLRGFEDYYPAEISGGMRKRAGLARAMALDPDILFFDEPSAGLDPVSAKRLDDLILELRDSLGTTIVVVTHELASIFAIGDDSIFLDADTKTPIARGNPRRLLEECDDPRVAAFLRRDAGQAVAT